MRSSIGAVSLANILLHSVTTPFLVGVGAAAPQGFVGVPDDRVTEDLPSDYSGSLRADDLRGRALASDHAASLDVVVTTPERADSYVDGSVIGGERTDVAIVLRDDVESGAREVALDAPSMRDALGYIPTQVWGTADDGSTWTAEARTEDGYLIFEVPHFSTQTVTFSSEVSLTGSPAVDGTEYSYTIDNYDSVTAPSINLTGVANTGTVTESGESTGSKTVDLIGVDEPGGPAGGEPEVAVNMGSSGNHYFDASELGSDARYPTVTLPSDFPTADYDVLLQNINMDTEDPVTFYLDVNGQQVWQDELTPSTCSICASAKAQATPTVELSGGDTLEMRVSRGSQYGIREVTEVEPSGETTISTDTGRSVTITDTGTAAIDLTGDETSLDISHTGDGIESWSLEYAATVETRDPVVVLNGETASYNGTLADGETTSLSLPRSALREGQNNVTVSVGSGTSDAGPVPSVGFDYRHRVESKRGVSISATRWTEEINVTRYFAESRTDGEVRVDFAGDVVGVRDLQVRKGPSASWQPISSGDYSFDGTTLTASIGDVSEATNVTVSGTGRKVSARNGDFTVVEPTVEGDELDTSIEVTEASDGFGIVTGNATSPVHYIANPSWSDESRAVIESGGIQFLSLPQANPGSTARVRTAPLAVDPTGEIEVRTYEVDETPKFGLSQGDTAGASRVEVTYLDAVSGQDYQLYSITNERTVVQGAAEEDSVTLATDGSSQTYEIREASSLGTAVVGVGGEDGSGGGADPLAVLALFAGIGLSVVGSLYVGRRFGIRGARQNTALLVVATIVGAVGVEAVTARSIVSDLIFAGGAAAGSAAAGFATSGVGAIIIGLALLSVLAWANARWGLPTWFLLTSGILVVAWTIDSVTDGAISSAMGELGPLIVLVTVGGAILLLWRALRGPTIRIGGGT